MSDLPPGMTPEMIPGNRPEDKEWDELMDHIFNSTGEHNMTGPEAMAVWDIGVKAWIAAREYVEIMRKAEESG